MSIKIESGIEIQAVATGGYRAGVSKYPFAEMKPGDSFLLKGETKIAIRNLSSQLMSAATHWARANGNGYEFKTRTSDKGARIWRTA